jgi:adenylate cyclase
MPSSRSVRKRSAVMFFDVVGYTRLMETDEEQTHRALMQIRSVFLGPTLASSRGHMIKETGDGFLATFDDPVDALNCALQIQNHLGKLAVDTPTSAQIWGRIALNFSDTIVEEHDVFGSGVNIAARLQNLAEPGCIIMSEAFMGLVREQVKLPVIDLGDLHLKNVREPVRAYSVRVAAEPARSGPLLDARDESRPSIAVLPFQYRSEDAADRYFAEGIVDDIVRALAGLKQLFVISRASALGFRGAGVDGQSAAAKLGVRYLLSGNVHRWAGKLRIGTELSDTATGTVLWAERFDGDVADLFELQDRISLQVVATVAPHVRERELQRTMRKHPESMDAYDLVLQAIELLYRMDYPQFSRARGLLQQAIVLDPAYAPAHAYAAQWHIHRVAQGWSQSLHADGQEAARLAAAAIDLDRHDGLALALHGHARSFLLKDYQAGRVFLDRALVASPNCALAWTLSSCTRTYLGDTKTAIEMAKYGLRLSPLDPLIFFYLHNLGMANYVDGDYDEAVLCGRNATVYKRDFRANLRVLCASLVALGRIAEAHEAAQVLLEAQPDFTVSDYAALCPFQDDDTRRLFLERLRSAGLPD